MSILKLIAEVFFNVATFGIYYSCQAGTLDWWRAWVTFLGVVLAGAVRHAQLFGFKLHGENR